MVLRLFGQTFIFRLLFSLFSGLFGNSEIKIIIIITIIIIIIIIIIMMMMMMMMMMIKSVQFGPESLVDILVY